MVQQRASHPADRTRRRAGAVAADARRRRGRRLTERATSRNLLDRDQYFARWAELHGGYDPRGAVLPRLWLGIVYVLSRPLARLRLRPDVVTLLALVAAGSAVPPAVAGGHWVLLALVAVVASGVLDNVDGCVAVLTGRVSRWGYLLDSLVDRLSDAVYAVVLWLVGAPAWLAVAGAGVLMLLEYARARAVGAGFSDIGVVTVAERPTRVIVLGFTLLGAGLVPSRADAAATVGGAVLGLLCVVGLGQFLLVARKALSEIR